MLIQVGEHRRRTAGHEHMIGTGIPVDVQGAAAQFDVDTALGPPLQYCGNGHRASAGAARQRFAGASTLPAVTERSIIALA